jgi:asparagine synthase (glutamine-hydrolysing)
LAVFAGLWQRRGDRAREGAAADLLAALHAPFHSVLSVFDEDTLVIGAKSLTRPAIVSHCGTVVALTGRLDGGLEAESVLDAYRDDGSGGLQNLSGDYGVAVYDPRHPTLILMRDAVGTQPLYYYASETVFAFGSQIKAVIAAAGIRAQPNHAAIASLLVSGEGLPRGETCFAGVHSVPPGFALFVTQDNISSTTHSDLRPIVPTPLRTFDQSAAAFKRALTDSVKRRMDPNGNTAILVSGGLDSAALLCAAAANSDADRILAISYGRSDGSGADERNHVNAVVSKAGVRSVFFDLEPIGFPDQVESDVLAGESPLIDDVPGTLRRAAAAARAHGAHNLLIGTWGDQVLFPFPPPYLLDLLRRGDVRSYRKLVRAMSGWMADVPRSQINRTLFGQAVRGFVPPGVLDRVRPLRRNTTGMFDLLPQQTTPRRHAPATHAAAVRREVTGAASVDAMEGTTKWGWAHGIEAQLPFLDADLIQLLFAIPAEHALHEGVPKALLRSAMTGIVPDSVLARRDKGDYTDAISACFKDVQAECVDRLENGMRLVKHGMMTRDAASRALARVIGRGEIDTSLLSTLVGLDAWLKVYFESPAGRPS